MAKSESIGFGKPEEWKKFTKKHPLFVEKLPNLKSALHIAFGRTFTSDEPLDGVIYFLGHLCREDFVEIVLLCGNGFGLGALKIIRGMYERAVTSQYLHLHPSELSRFLNYHWIQHRRLVRAVQDTFETTVVSSEQLAKLDERFRDVKDEYLVTDCKKCKTTRLAHTWSRLDFVSMAREAGSIGKLIVPAYYIPMRETHSTPGAIFDRTDSTEPGTVAFDLNAHSTWASEALLTAHSVILHVLVLQKERFALQVLEEPIETCLRDFRLVWKRPAPETQPIPGEQGRE